MEGRRTFGREQASVRNIPRGLGVGNLHFQSLSSVPIFQLISCFMVFKLFLDVHSPAFRSVNATMCT